MKKLVVRVILMYVRFFARIAVRRSKATIIGITGSVGKTSTRDALYALLKNSHKTYVIQKGNSETGVPLGLLGLGIHSIGFDSWHASIIDWTRMLLSTPFRTHFLRPYAYVIVEMGIDDPFPPKNMSYLLSIVKPHIAVLLNVFPVHALNFEKAVSTPITRSKILRAIAHEKARIITDNSLCRFAVWDATSEPIAHELEGALCEHSTFGSPQKSELTLIEHDIDEQQTTFIFKHITKGTLTLRISGHVLPRGFGDVFAASMLVGEHLGLTYSDMIESLQSHFTLESGRSSLLQGLNESLIIDSSYNSSPEAVLSMLALAKTLKKKLNRPLIFVCGDMRELGNQSAPDHTRVMEACKDDVDAVYTVGPLSKKYIFQPLATLKNIDTMAFDGPHSVGRHLKQSLPSRSLVLFKGSQNTLFLEEAIKYILNDSADSAKLPRQEKYWLQKKQFVLQENPDKKII